MDVRVGIVGTGVMGRSISLRVLQSGLEAVLFDSDPQAAAAASAWIASRASFKGATGSASASENSLALPESALAKPVAPAPPYAEQSGRTSANPTLAASIAELADCDVLIEAVVENRAVKRRVLGGLSSANRSALIATNTSSLSIAELSEAIVEPGRFCGLHFCHPIEECPLVEVVPGRATTEATLQGAESFARRLGMQPLRTPDVPGFAVNRLLLPYLDAAVALVRGGVDWQRIDLSAVDFGMRIGPLSQMDEIGIDVILRAAAAFHRGNPVIPQQSELLLAMYQAGRLGRKKARGFFDYAGGGPALDPAAIELASQHRTASIECTDAEITLRLFIPMLRSACQLLEQRLVADTARVRQALVAGLGCRGQAGDLPGWGRALGRDVFANWLTQLKLPPVSPEILEDLFRD